MGPAQPSAVRDMRSSIPAVSDRRLPPIALNTTERRRAPGVVVAYMTLPPALGGFSMLRVTENIHACDSLQTHGAIAGMCWLLRPNPLWPPRLLLAVFRHIPPVVHTLKLLRTGGRSQCMSARGIGSGLSGLLPGGGVFAVGAHGFTPTNHHYIYDFYVINTAFVAIDGWCYHMPLWGNPL